MKKIVILGSTGIIGKKALQVIFRHRDRFQIVGLTANRNFKLLLNQARSFKVKKICLRDSLTVEKVKADYRGLKVFAGREGLLKILDQDIDLVFISISGTEAIYPLLYAVERNIDIALANKEAIIAIGEIIIKKLQKSRTKIIPLDSEHNAIYQILSYFKKDGIKNIILTCSGGPFLDFSEKDLEKVTPEMALSHPKWKMGKKITVDSATLMNKGFEIIEAHYLFQLPAKKIKVLIHPQATVHGMVELCDGTTIACLAPTDMKMAISYALGYPQRLNTGLRINWHKTNNLNFRIPDQNNCLAFKIANKCLNLRKSYPCFLVKIDEIMVNEFIKGRIKFNQILKLIWEALKLHRGFEIKDFVSVEKTFQEAQEISDRLLKNEGVK